MACLCVGGCRERERSDGENRGRGEEREESVTGQFLIDSEASTKASFMRMSQPDNATVKKSEMAMEDEISLILGMGTITEIFKDEQILKIDHQPIEVLNWPRMEMKFSTLKDNSEIDFDALNVGDHIEFKMQKVDGKYLIIEVSSMVHEGEQ